MTENKDIVTCMDTNIDTSDNSSHNRTFKTTQLLTNFRQHLQTHDLTILNNRYTRITKHQQPSTIDHITTNVPTKCNNTQTHLNIDSDHCILTTTYNTKHQITNPKYITIRNNNLLTKNKLQKYVTNSIPLQEIFAMTDPNEIAETIQIELNAIMNTIAPPKNIQFKKDYSIF